METSDQKYLRQLIAEGEHQKLDFKFAINDARKIAKTLSAFSNTDGGRLLIGVKDNGKVSGIKSDEEYYMVESAASLYCKPEVKFDYRNLSLEGKNVLEIYIPPVVVKPVYARDEENRWMAYKRVNDENMLANIVQLEVWKEERNVRGKLIEFTRREEILLDFLHRKPDSSLSRIQHDTGFKRKELISLLTRLVLFDVVEIKTGDGMSLFKLKEKPGE